MINLLVCAAAFAGVKGTTAYTVRSEPVGPAREIILDLSDVLAVPDPDVGSRRPLSLRNPVAQVWLAADRAPRAPQRLWPGTQAGQYRARVLATGELNGIVRVDAERDDGKAFALIIPLAKDFTLKQIPKPAAPPQAGVAVLGKALFDKQCTACHATSVFGDPERAWRVSDDAFFDAIWLPALDAADVYSYLLPLRPAPPPKKYTLHWHTITDDERKAARREGVALDGDRILLVPLYEGIGYVPEERIDPKKEKRAGYGAIRHGRYSTDQTEAVKAAIAAYEKYQAERNWD